LIHGKSFLCTTHIELFTIVEEAFDFLGSSDYKDVVAKEDHQQQVGSFGATNIPYFDDVAFVILRQISHIEKIAKKLSVALTLAYQLTF